MKLVWGSSFKKAHKKSIQKNTVLSSKFNEKIKIFEEDPFHPALRTHKLTGKLIGLYAFTVDYDCRVVFQFLSPQKIMLVDIGKHDEVY